MGLRRLSTGEVGVAGSADTINAGGQKIVSDFNELYKAYGDHNLLQVIQDPTDSEEYITVHPAGYHQRHALSVYSTPVETGSMHDIDSALYSAGTTLTIKLPTIVSSLTGVSNTSGKYARIGDKIEFQDTADSWSIVPLLFTAATGQTIDGLGTFKMSQSYCRIVLTCTSATAWSSKIEPISGILGKGAIEKSLVLTSGTTNYIELCNISSYDVLKLVVYAYEYSPSTSSSLNWSSCEMMVLNNQDSTMNSRYAVTETGSFLELGTTIQNGVLWLTAKQLTNSSRVILTVTSVQASKALGVYRSIVDKKMNVTWDI